MILVRVVHTNRVSMDAYGFHNSDYNDDNDDDDEGVPYFWCFFSNNFGWFFQCNLRNGKL